MKNKIILLIGVVLLLGGMITLQACSDAYEYGPGYGYGYGSPAYGYAPGYNSLFAPSYGYDAYSYSSPYGYGSPSAYGYPYTYSYPSTYAYYGPSYGSYGRWRHHEYGEDWDRDDWNRGNWNRGNWNWSNANRSNWNGGNWTGGNWEHGKGGERFGDMGMRARPFVETGRGVGRRIK